MKLKNKVGWIITLTVEYIFIFILSYQTPLYADDLLETHLSLSEIWQRGINDYMSTNGRLFGQLIYRILDNLPIFLFAIVNAAVFCGFTILIFKIINRNRPSLLKYLILLLVIFITLPAFGQTVLWKAGTGNYLWMTTIILIYLIGNFGAELCDCHWQNRGFKYLLPFISFISGWGNENTSLAAIILSLLILFDNLLINKQQIKYNQWFNTLCLTAGYLCLMLAPASHNRTTISPTIFTAGNGTYMSKLLIGCLNVILTVGKYYFILLVAIAIMIYIMKKYYFNSFKATYALFFIITGGLSIMTLVVAPMYTWDGGRAYFGGVTFLIIALFILFPTNLQSFASQNVWKYACTFTAIIALFLIFIGYLSWGLLDWYQANQAIKQRYEYVQYQVDKGHKIVRVKPLSYQPQTKYAINTGLADISLDSNFWMNKGYYQYFPGLNKITP